MTDESKGVRGRSKLFTNLTSVLLVAGLGVALAATEAKAESDFGYRGSDKLQKIVRKIFDRQIKVENVYRHLVAWQEIADRNNDNRASGTTGYDQSVDYVVEQLRRKGYKITRQEFDFPFFQELSDPAFERVDPAPTVYPPNTAEGFFTMSYSGSGDATAEIEAVDFILPPAPDANTSTSGCEAEDFAGFTPGRIALIQRGTCTFFLKAQNAENAGAVGVSSFNEGPEGRTDAINGTLGEPSLTIPVVGTTFAIGDELVAQASAGVVTARVAVDALSEFRPTENLIADLRAWPHQRDKPVIVLGAHLDSVEEGPGISDNGTGSGALLEIARKLRPYSFLLRNRIRFAWWGAEESGLLGAEFYVANLTEEELAETAMYLNFDMIGSPNYVPFVFDGDGSDFDPVGPPGSDIIEQVFQEAFLDRGVNSQPTELSGRSDYLPFSDAGIPVGGLFTGAEGIKTEAQAAEYGGTAGEQYDSCYHTPCDTLDNLSLVALELNSKVTADAMLQFAFAELPLVPAAPALTLSSFSASAATGYDFEYLGSRLRK